MSIQDNIKEIKKEIKKACEKSNRNLEDVTLIAVTKTVPISEMKECFDYGIRIFGESKVQEFLPKYEYFKDTVKWHFIGHLQSNKVKYIIDKVDLIHSIDSFKLLETIDNQAKNFSKVQKVLLQVNLAKEESKYGFEKEELLDLIPTIAKMRNIEVLGLMIIPPFSEDSQDTRRFFKELKELSVDIKHKNNDNIVMNYLSMGMTMDYAIAIEEGSNFIRVGTGIFGERQYK